ncbi:TRNA splicing endonuclease [Spironucleus salmonicida]|uniref:tRNA-intron lyase n=1 Tax=Spironucleus salmonicida TaxID=348837 RepID=V6LIX8_9EUKA|nr:TRNA splicing endonuclease [Spironucleus salmonicida]|eukprot:EST44565.1 tRNA splicing endonuclease [Spironucleus salmonicida]
MKNNSVVDYSLQGITVTLKNQYKVIIERSPTRLLLPPLLDLYYLGIGVSTKGQGPPSESDSLEIEIDEYIYLQSLNIIDNIENFTSSTFVFYKYLRQKNYIPKTGIQYGCSFLLYEQCQDLIHACYLVSLGSQNLIKLLTISRRHNKQVLILYYQDGKIASKVVQNFKQMPII